MSAAPRSLVLGLALLLVGPLALLAWPAGVQGAAVATPVAVGTDMVDGVPYTPALDTAGGRAQYDKWHHEMFSYGIPDPDAARIAFAWVKDWCQHPAKVPAGCAATGFDLSGVDVRDGHALGGHNDQCEVWGVDFIPQWGQDRGRPNHPCPPGAPKRQGLSGARATSCGTTAATSAACAGGGSSGVGGTSAPDGSMGSSASTVTDGSNGTGQACVGDLCVSVSIPLPGPTQLAQAVLAALNWEDVLRQFLQAVYRVIVGDAFEQLGGQGAQLLLLMPDLRTSGGAMANVQQLVDALREAAVALCLVVFAFTLVQFLFGQESEPFGLFTRLGAVLFALGYYRLLLGWLLGGCNAIAGGILTIGADQTTDILPNLLKGLVPVTAPLWYLVALVGLVFLLALLVVEIVGFAILLILYVAGPLLLPLALHPRTASWVGLWLEHLVKALLWPALWALELRLFGALANGLSLVDPTGHVALQALEGSALGALTALAMLALMVVTPWGFHTRFTVRQGAVILSRTAMRAADSVVLVASGGTTMNARMALANSLAARRQPTEATE